MVENVPVRPVPEITVNVAPVAGVPNVVTRRVPATVWVSPASPNPRPAATSIVTPRVAAAPCVYVTPLTRATSPYRPTDRVPLFVTPPTLPSSFTKADI